MWTSIQYYGFDLTVCHILFSELFVFKAKSYN